MSAFDASPPTPEFTSEMDEALLQTLIDAKNDGHRLVYGEFEEVAWTSALDKVRAAQLEGAPAVDKARVQNRWNELKEGWIKFRQFKGRSKRTYGWSWDENKKTCQSTEEDMDDFFNSNPYYRQFRDKGLPFYEQLQELLKYQVATGEHAVSINDIIIETDRKKKGLGNYPAPEEDIGTMTDGPDSFSDEEANAPSSNCWKASPHSKKTAGAAPTGKDVRHHHHMTQAPSVGEEAGDVFMDEYLEVLPSDWKSEDGQIPCERWLPFLLMLSNNTGGAARAYLTLRKRDFPCHIRYKILSTLLDQTSNQKWRSQEMNM